LAIAETIVQAIKGAITIPVLVPIRPGLGAIPTNAPEASIGSAA
jgi:hypothetical protein